MKYTTYIWPYKIKYDYFMTEQVIQAFRGLCFPQYDTHYQIAKISQDWHHLMILTVASDWT